MSIKPLSHLIYEERFTFPGRPEVYVKQNGPTYMHEGDLQLFKQFPQHYFELDSRDTCKHMGGEHVTVVPLPAIS